MKSASPSFFEYITINITINIASNVDSFQKKAYFIVFPCRLTHKIVIGLCYFLLLIMLTILIVTLLLL